MAAPPVSFSNPISTSVEKVRILVVGDSGTGKSSLVHQLCHGEVLSTPPWTIGCRTEVKLHTCVVDGHEKSFFIEFWEVGGHRNFKLGRQMFYQKVNGIMLVYDMKNLKSFHNLRTWIAEIVKAKKSRKDGIEENFKSETFYSNANNTSGTSQGVSLRANPYNYQEFTTEIETKTDTESKQKYIKDVFGALPMIIVGNKTDLMYGASLSAPPNTLQTYGIDSVNLSSLKPEMDKLNPFFQRVIEHRHFPHLDQNSRVGSVPSNLNFASLSKQETKLQSSPSQQYSYLDYSDYGDRDETKIHIEDDEYIL